MKSPEASLAGAIVHFLASRPMEIDLTDLPRPATVREAVDILLQDLGPENLDELRATAEDDLIFHLMGLGRFIRNVFGLHGENPALLASTGAAHPDDASMVIIESLWQRLRLH